MTAFSPWWKRGAATRTQSSTMPDSSMNLITKFNASLPPAAGALCNGGGAQLPPSWRRARHTRAASNACSPGSVGQ
eukprot:4864167-Prorocentrum_lima.AAC.1